MLKHVVLKKEIELGQEKLGRTKLVTAGVISHIISCFSIFYFFDEKYKPKENGKY